MNRLLPLLIAAVLPAVATPAAALQPVTMVAEVAVPRITVIRDGDRWTADFILDRDAAVWAFRHSALLRVGGQPWRPDWWSVETAGVVLDRQGRYDVLRRIDGGPVPRRLRVVFHPRQGDLQADYDPALMFSDGTVALFSDQFDLIPLGSLDAARSLPMDLNGLEVEGGPSSVTWRDTAGPVLFNGARVEEATAADANTYVLFGEAHIREGEGVTTVIDPGLPSWLGAELGGFTPRVMKFYADRLGPSRAGAPTLMVSWAGPTAGLSSMGGSVLPGLISMTFEGEGVLDPDKAALDRAHWFIGHESAHFWMGSNGLKYEFARDAWITEGGADLMAIRAISAIDPTYNARSELQREVDDCVEMARNEPVSTAGERGDNRAYYACGAVWALALESAQMRRDGSDFFAVVARFQTDNAADQTLSRTEWLAELTRVAGDGAPAETIARMLDVGVSDPALALAGLFDQTGVAYRLDAGHLTLQ